LLDQQFALAEKEKGAIRFPNQCKPWFRLEMACAATSGQSVSGVTEGLVSGLRFLKGRLRGQLEAAAKRANDNFPANEHLRIENGEPVLKRLQRKPEPGGLSRLEQQLAEHMTHVDIVDALSDTEHWLNQSFLRSDFRPMGMGLGQIRLQGLPWNANCSACRDPRCFLGTAIVPGPPFPSSDDLP
jgi:hypothetical protein